MRIVLNHKSHFTKEQILDYQKSYDSIAKENLMLTVCPSSCYLSYFEGCSLGSQDISPHPFGAYTGGVAGDALKSLGVTYVLIHHSERSIAFGETLEMSKNKFVAALDASLLPILCIGETLEEYEDGKTMDSLKKQLDFFFTELHHPNCILAYEPLYAIGTGIVPTKEHIQKTIQKLKEYYNYEVLYGGSVNQHNVAELKGINGLDGFLLGGISLNLEALKELLQKL